MKTTPNSDASNPARPENRDRESELQEAREFLREKTKPDNEAFKPYISMYSLSLTLFQLVELYDHQPGKEQRMKVLDELAKQFNEFTSLPQK